MTGGRGDPALFHMGDSMSVFAEALRDKKAADEQAAEEQAIERNIIAGRLAEFRRVLNPILSIAEDAPGLRGRGGETLNLHTLGHRWRFRLGEARLGFLLPKGKGEAPADYSHVVLLSLYEVDEVPGHRYDLEVFNSLSVDFSGLSRTLPNGQETLRWSWFGPLSSPLWKSVTRLYLRDADDPAIHEIGLRIAGRFADLADPKSLPVA